MATQLITKAKTPTDAIFGVDADGNAVIVPIASGPHYLVGGQTGSGKSVYINTILVSMMSHSLPSELQIIWIDPKKVEATAYKGLPYSMVDPVIDMDDAYGLLQYLAWLMDERYETLESLELKKIDEYNEWCEENPDQAREMNCEKWPFIVLVIDEYADLVMVQPTVEKVIARLGQKARAAGIHLLIATQRPSADIITGLIKANVPSRVGLKTFDSNNSRIIIDEDGCENLRGNGDSILITNSGEYIRCQGPFLTNGEIKAIFEQIIELYGTNDPVDYKTFVVEQGLCSWKEDYADDVPLKDRHVTMKRRSFGGL